MWWRHISASITRISLDPSGVLLLPVYHYNVSFVITSFHHVLIFIGSFFRWKPRCTVDLMELIYERYLIVLARFQSFRQWIKHYNFHLLYQIDESLSYGLGNSLSKRSTVSVHFFAVSVFKFYTFLITNVHFSLGSMSISSATKPIHLDSKLHSPKQFIRVEAYNKIFTLFWYVNTYSYNISHDTNSIIYLLICGIWCKAKWWNVQHFTWIVYSKSFTFIGWWFV